MDWFRSTCRVWVRRLCRCRNDYRDHILRTSDIENQYIDDDDDDDDEEDDDIKIKKDDGSKFNDQNAYILQVNTKSSHTLATIANEIGKGTYFAFQNACFLKVDRFHETKVYNSLIIRNDFYIINGIEIQRFPSNHAFAL